MPWQNSSLFIDEIADAGDLSPVLIFFPPIHESRNLDKEHIWQRMTQVQ